MKLGLLGFPIDHSLSPSLYERLLGNKLSAYKKFSCSSPEEIPSLADFSREIDGLSITSPYKKFFVRDVLIPNPLVKELGIINTIAFCEKAYLATNTDLLAVMEILGRYQHNFGELWILLLGDGAMAKVTKQVAGSLNIKLDQFARKPGMDISHLDLRQYSDSHRQPLIINACSRSFVFQGKLSGQELFWDYNYNFLPHEKTIPRQVKDYQDGQELLERQAMAAIKFWEEVNPKLK